MNFKGRSKSVAIILATAAVGTFLLARPFSSNAADGPLSNSVAPSTQPADTTPAKTIQQISAQLGATSRQLGKILTPAVLSDPTKRAEAAPKAIPLAYRNMELLDEMDKKVPPATIDQLRQNSLATLYLLNDQPTVTKVNDMKSSTDEVRQLNGQSVELLSQWLAAGSSNDAATKVIDDVEKLDKAHPESSRLTMLTLGMAQSAHSMEQNTRLLALVSDVMTDPYAKKISAQIAAQKKVQAEAEAKQKAFMDKPFVVAAKTVEGKDFTTADLKGKVVLVDFWATWCGPCKAGLPHVVETYNKYHDQGLEIVGISNDYSAKALTDFTPKNGMPWTQLFDADAAANHKWNPLSDEYGVNGIPCMFLIDKKGVLRSVTARADMDTLIPKLLAE